MATKIEADITDTESQSTVELSLSLYIYIILRSREHAGEKREYIIAIQSERATLIYNIVLILI